MECTKKHQEAPRKTLNLFVQLGALAVLVIRRSKPPVCFTKFITGENHE
jgi:hypothetical protein